MAIGKMSSNRKTYRVRQARTEGTTADALYETKWLLTSSHKTCELLLCLHSAKIGHHAFEFYVHNQTTSLCITAPAGPSDAVHGIWYTPAFEGDIEEIEDFTESIQQPNVTGVAEVAYWNWDIYPGLNYKDTMCITVGPLLNALSQVDPEAKVIFQTVLFPLGSNFRLHSYLWFFRRLDGLIHFMRPKYWFKRGVRDEQLERIQKKAKSKWLRAEIRISITYEGEAAVKNLSQTKKKIKHIVDNLMTGVSIQNHPDCNAYEVRKIRYDEEAFQKVKDRYLGGWFRPTMRLSVNEVPGFWNVPGIDGAPNLTGILARRWNASPSIPTSLTDPNCCPFGTSNYRHQSFPVGMAREDRRRHLFVLGNSGSGKSSLLKLLMQKDFEHGYGVGVLDPNGALIDDVLNLIPRERADDVVIFDPEDIDFPASLNPFELVGESSRLRVASGLIEMFHIRFEEQWSDRIEHLLLYTVLALLNTQWTTVLSLRRMLVEEEYRKSVIPNIQDRVVRDFWQFEFPYWEKDHLETAIEPIRRMVGEFVGSETLRLCLGQPFNKFDFREIIDSKKILLMKISNQALGDDNASLLGAMVLTRIYQAAMSRADTPYDRRNDFYLFVDDFDEFATASFDEILSESRKYALNLTVTTNNLGLLPVSLRSTIFGNVGNLISFRTTSEDSSALARELLPRVSASDLTNLPAREFYAKLSVRSISQEVFSGRTLDLQYPAESMKERAIRHSRMRYCLPRDQAIDVIQTWGKVG